MRQPKIAFCTSKISRINSVLLFPKLSDTKKTIPERIWLTLLHVACGVAQNLLHRYHQFTNVKIAVIMDHSGGFNRSETNCMLRKIQECFLVTHKQFESPKSMHRLIKRKICLKWIWPWRQLWDEFGSNSAAGGCCLKIGFQGSISWF